MVVTSEWSFCVKKRGVSSRMKRSLLQITFAIAASHLRRQRVAARGGAPGGQRVGQAHRHARRPAGAGAEIREPLHRVREVLPHVRHAGILRVIRQVHPGEGSCGLDAVLLVAVEGTGCRPAFDPAGWRRSPHPRRRATPRRRRAGPAAVGGADRECSACHRGGSGRGPPSRLTLSANSCGETRSIFCCWSNCRPCIVTTET